MNKLSCLVVSILFLGAAGNIFAAATVLPPTGYGLAWSDEFDSPTVNSANWTFDTGVGNPPGWGNAELEYYTNGTNFTIDSGYGKLWAKQQSMGGRSYTSCRMNTKGKKEFKYGYFETKLRTAKGNGLWNAFWTLGGNIDTIGWPACGEVELYEQRTGAVQHAGTAGDNCFIQTCHYGSTYATGTGAIYNAHQTNTSTCLCNAFHTYSILWDSLSIIYYFDGTQVWSSPSINLSNNFKSFHQPHFFIANMAVGGNYQALDGGTVDNSIFPQQMAIDYIRVYQKDVITQAMPGEKRNTLENITLVNQASATLKVFSLKGELVADLSKNLRAMKTGENAVQKSMSGLSRGAYVVRCTDNNRTISQKVVVSR